LARRKSPRAPEAIQDVDEDSVNGLRDHYRFNSSLAWSFGRAVEGGGLRPRLDFSRLSNLVEFGAHREPQAAGGAFRNDLIDVERPWTNQRHRVEDKARDQPVRRVPFA